MISRRVASTPTCRGRTGRSLVASGFDSHLLGLLWVAIFCAVAYPSAAGQRHRDGDRDSKREQPYDNDSKVVNPNTGETESVIRQDRFDGHYDVRDPKTGERRYRIDRDCFLTKCK